LSGTVTLSKGDLFLCTGTNPPTNCQFIAGNLQLQPGAVLADFDPSLLYNGECVFVLDACDDTGYRP
jgi:hypothetical protein